MYRKWGEKWCDGLWVWKMKKNVVVFRDGRNNSVVGRQGVLVVTMNWNGRGERRKKKID